MSIDPTDPEYQEYARFWNAVAGTLIDYCAANEHDRPLFSERRRFADAAWRELHPDSKYGNSLNESDSKDQR